MHGRKRRGTLERRERRTLLTRLEHAGRELRVLLGWGFRRGKESAGLWGEEGKRRKGKFARKISSFLHLERWFIIPEQNIAKARKNRGRAGGLGY